MNKAKILIVEDESLVARDIQSMLTGLGYAVVGVVSTGREAVQTAVEKRPDLILMDIVLKGGTDGIQAATIIRQSQDVPIIYLTAFADEPTLERAKKTCPQGYLLKPFEQQALSTAIELALYKHEVEVKLRTSERWFASILDHFGSAVITCDSKGLITFMNPLAETLTGWTQGDALGRPMLKFIRFLRADTGKPLAIPIKKLILKGRWEAPARCWLPDKAGTESLVDIHATFIKDERSGASHLVFVLRRTARSHEDEKRLAFAAIRDPLTGLPNRILFEDRLELDIARSSRKRQKAVIVLISLLGLKDIKARFGRNEEDRLLQKAASRILKSIRASDSVARFGDNEFILLLTDISGIERALEVIQRIQNGLEKGFSFGDYRFGLKSLFGMAIFPEDGETPRSLIEKAESALWRARNSSPWQGSGSRSSRRTNIKRKKE